MTNTSITLDSDTADRIALQVMREHLAFLVDEVARHLSSGNYMHPEDLEKTQRTVIPALETLIDYFGG